VHELVSRHRCVGFVSNIDDRFALPPRLGRFNRQVYQHVPARWTEKGRVRFAPSEAYRILDRAVSPLLSAPTHDLTAADATPELTERFRAFFSTRARVQRVPVFLHKFTGWPRVGFVDAAFPQARYVHVVRDGRAVANSWLQMPWWNGRQGPDAQWGPLPAAYRAEWEASHGSVELLAALGWKLLIDAFDAARAALADDARWLEVRYEDVVAEPVDMMRRIAAHCELDWSTELERAVTTHPFNPASTSKWRTQMQPGVVELLTRSLGGHLERFGYDA
jgi:hypothetical protein